MNIADIQRLIQTERANRYQHISNLVDLVLTKISTYLINADSTFHFDKDKMCFEISQISNDLSDLIVCDFTLNEEDYIFSPFSSATVHHEWMPIISENNSNLFTEFKDFQYNLDKILKDSLYHLNLNSTEWGLFCKYLELKGFTPLVYTEKTYDTETEELVENWRDVTKIVIFVDSTF